MWGKVGEIGAHSDPRLLLVDLPGEHKAGEGEDKLCQMEKRGNAGCGAKAMVRGLRGCCCGKSPCIEI